jgi:hypothetical protein
MSSQNLPVPIPVRAEFNEFNEHYPGVAGFSKFDENNLYKFKPISKWVGGKKQMEQWAMRLTSTGEGATQKSAPFLLTSGGRKSRHAKRSHTKHRKTKAKRKHSKRRHATRKL